MKKTKAPSLTKKRNQPSSSSSSSQQNDVSPFDPVNHGLQLNKHFIEAESKATQFSTMTKDCLRTMNQVGDQIDKIIEQKPNDPEIKKLSEQMKQIVSTISLLTSKSTELERINHENQTAFELFKSSIYEYLFNTVQNDVELISQFEQHDKVKVEKRDSDEDDVIKKEEDQQTPKKKPIRRALVPPECR